MAKGNKADQSLKSTITGGLDESVSIKARFRHWAVGQFKQPRGFWGWIAGLIMANRGSNILRSHWAVELLDIQADENVLEIGYGPGIAIKAIAKRLQTGKVTGIDHSRVMRQQATRRNQRDIAEGRVELLQGTPTDLAPDAGPFQKVLAVNVVMFWDDPIARLVEIRKKMPKGGVIVLTLQPRSPKATDKDARHAGELMCDQLRSAGFRQVRLEMKPMKPVSAASAVGEN